MIAARKHRLNEEAYTGHVTVAFTACLADRTKLLATPKNVEPLLDILKISVLQHDCTVPIYCFMPDHAHLVLRGSSASSSVKAAIEVFKKRSGRWLRYNRPGIRWQKGYWDHVVWPDSDWSEQVRYIAANPCRKGLVDDALAWPFTGSLGHKVQDILVEAIVR